jgi:hypothetical protein
MFPILCYKKVSSCSTLFSNSNRVTGIYELSLCKMADTGSPGKLLSIGEVIVIVAYTSHVLQKKLKSTHVG